MQKKWLKCGRNEQKKVNKSRKWEESQNKAYFNDAATKLNIECIKFLITKGLCNG